MMDDGQPEGLALEVSSLRKVYGATLALDSVSFGIGKGKVHALLGENGAGKSTIVKLLSGLIEPNSGTIAVFGEATSLRSPRAAHAHGIRTAFQELTLCPDLTVAQNFLLPDNPVHPWGSIKARSVSRSLGQYLNENGLVHVDPDEPVRKYDLATRQKIEIARAVYREPKILLLDEPTASLSGPDIDWLDAIINRLRNQGVTAVFISHRLPEVRRFCDTLTVLRNGKAVLDGRVADRSDKEIIESIVGRSISKAFPEKTPRKTDAAMTPILEARNLSTEGGVSDVSLTLHQGEIVGLGALQGMGQQELLEALFGAVRIASGSVLVRGKSVALGSPRDAIRAEVGIGLVPEERKTDGLFLRMSGQRNAAYPILPKLSRAGLVDQRAEYRTVRGMFKRVQVIDRALEAPMSTFSGGNQQKVAIAKWLVTQNPILLMLDPTRGVDVGTKHEIYLLMQEFAAAGGAILFYSTEIEELVHLSHRVLVLYKGRIAAELTDDNPITEEGIVAAALGGLGHAGGERAH